nr:hypothetical protein [Streptomyces sp. SID10853]
MTRRLPTAWYRAQPRPRSGPRGARYSAGVSTDQTAEPSGPRPARLTAAAALAALEGAAMAAGGLYVIGKGVFADGDSPEQSVLAGLTLIVLALIPLLAARGLLLRRSWSRGPAIVTQIIALPVAWTLLSAQGVLIPAGVVLAVVALVALVLLVNPTTAEALGIRSARGA